ncbi:MAG: hypothetical protein Q8K96_16755 [Rubrivivax sp.]|nr:hypothetical protein [Rubrivivax sp.]
MRHGKLSAVQLFAGATLALCLGPTHAQTTANGPYYATPSWDQSLPVATRFIVLSNMASEAVLDRETGLVWQRTPNPTLTTLGGAERGCGFSRTGSRMGWRIPSLLEFQSLMEAPGGIAALPAGHPFIIPAGVSFWSTSAFGPAVRFPDNFLSFNPANGGGAGFAGASSAVSSYWCVRGGASNKSDVLHD